MSTIELTDEMAVSPRSVPRRAAVFVAKLALCVAASIVISEGASIVADYATRQYRAAAEYLAARLGETRIIRELVPAREVPTAELVRDLSIEAGISPIVTARATEKASATMEASAMAIRAGQFGPWAAWLKGKGRSRRSPWRAARCRRPCRARRGSRRHP